MPTFRRNLHAVCTALFALTLALALAACGGDDTKAEAQKQQPPAPLKLKAVRVEPTEAATTEEFVSQVQAKETVDIRARVAGFLDKRHYKEGAIVDKNELLFTIDPTEYKQTTAEAKGELDRNQASLDKARTDVKRFKELYERGAVSREEYDSKVTDFKQLQATVQSNKAQLDQMRTNLGYTEVRSPITGRAGRAQVDEGSLVGQGENTLLCQVTSVDPIYVNFNISEQDYLRYIKQKQEHPDAKSAKLELVLGDGSVYGRQGEVDMVDPSIDPTTGTLGVRAVFPNPDGLLLPGQFARVRATMQDATKHLLVPKSALKDVQGVKQVFVAEDGKAAAKIVTLGQDVGNESIVTKGLEAGDVVLVEGLQKLRTGAPVDPLLGDHDGDGAVNEDAAADAGAASGSDSGNADAGADQ